MDDRLLRRVKALRAQSITPLPMRMAFAIARAELNPPVGHYPFLSALDDYGNRRVTGEVKGLHVAVDVEQDEYFELGGDDVTGTFTDTASERTIKNDGGSRNGYEFYEMSNVRWSGGIKALSELGMSKSVAERAFWDLVRQDMNDDRDRISWSVTVCVSYESGELVSGSVSGIDEVESFSATPRIIEVAVDLIDEAFTNLRTDGAALIKAAEGRAKGLAAALAKLED